jgi:hypothetical protein
MEPDQGGKTPPSEEPKPPQAQQSVSATGGSSIREVVQLAVGGNYEGDIIFNYSRSELEELDDYLKRAMVTYEACMYQALLPRPLSEEPYKEREPFMIEDDQIFFGRDARIDELQKKLINAGFSPRLIADGRLPVYIAMRPYEENPVRFLKMEMSSSLGPWRKMLEGLSLNDFLGLICNYRSDRTSERASRPGLGGGLGST